MGRDTSKLLTSSYALCVRKDTLYAPTTTLHLWNQVQLVKREGYNKAFICQKKFFPKKKRGTSM